MTVVNTTTGEIIETGSALALVDKTAVSVVSMLEEARRWLATAVETTGPAEIALAKAQIATAETWTKELRLSKEIQLDATEMVRRAEYALGRSIRIAQAEGTVRSLGDNAAIREDPGGDITRIPSVKDIAPEFYNNGSEMAVMADQATPEEFDAAIEEAKAEENLSRANVVRKIKGEPGGATVTRDMRAEMIRNLADEGYSSRQMPKKVGVSEETIRQIARDFDIEIPADRVIRGTRRLDHTQMVENSVTGFENAVSALQYIDLDEVDFGQVDEWVASLSASIAALNRFKKQIAKEATHV
ncbi:MAG: hypothetical protein J7518_16550 [Nocardioidaceae bacterium]|nr:hypothetical protein [Nocardioidaceae bacterium]